MIKTLLDSDEDMLGMMLTEKSHVKGQRHHHDLFYIFTRTPYIS